MPKLSILIPTMNRRKHFLERLMGCLDNQVNGPYSVEILTNCDDGEKTIGQKRNELVEQSKGDYVVFIDDDDIVTENYLEEIFRGILAGVDHIGICGWYEPTNLPKCLFKCSKYYQWEFHNNTYYRSAQHLCAIRRSIAFSVRFPHISSGEDKAWSDIVNTLIGSEYLINTPIYTYLFIPNKTI